MSDQIDISREAVDGVAAFWWDKGYPKIADLLWSLRAAIDAAEAEKARAVGMVEELMARMDWFSAGDHPSAYAEEEGFRQRLAEIRTGAKP